MNKKVLSVKSAKKESVNSKSLKNKSSKNKKSSNAKYDIDSLMSNKDKNVNIKRASSYLISKTTTEERRKKLGLI